MMLFLMYSRSPDRIAEASLVIARNPLERFDEIGKSIAAHFERAGLSATIRCLSVPDRGQTTTTQLAREA